MNADELCTWLRDGRPTQREKLATLKTHYLERIREMYDDDYLAVMRAIKKRLGSPKVAAELAELVALLADHPSNPRPKPGDAPRPVQSLMPVDGDHAAQLEAAIAADPTTRDTYVVYGDWLEGSGDPRGQLVAIGGELAKNPGHKTMLAAHADHLRAHPQILGPLGDCDDIVTNVEWFMGFIRKARVSYTMERFNGPPPSRQRLKANQLPPKPQVRVEDVVGWLLDEPGPGRFLQDLTLGIVRHDDMIYEPTVRVIARKPRPSLQRLFIGDFASNECELNWATIGDMTTLWPMVPNLRELTLRAGGMTIGAIHLPRLERLSTITGGLDEDSLAYIAAADWPELHTLSLHVGPEGGANSAHVLEPLLGATRVPKLRHLGIANAELTDDFVARLVDSRLLPQLEKLDLTMGTMTDASVETIAKDRDRFAHLELFVDENYLPADAEPRLARCVKRLVFGGQRADDPEDRRAAYYE